MEPEVFSPVISSARIEIQQQLPRSFVTTSFERHGMLRWVCNDVWMDIFHLFDHAQLGLKLALISPRFDALVDAHFNGKSELRIWRPILIHKKEKIIKKYGDKIKVEEFPLPDHSLHNKIRFFDLSIKYLQMESFCCVCKAIYGGSHSCSVCKLPCHTFCGDSGGVENEGFGGKVVCHNCVNEEGNAPIADQNDERELRNNKENEGTPTKDKKRHRNNDTVKKLEAVEWAQKNSIHAAAKKFKVDRKVIKDWMAHEDKLRKQIMTPNGGKRMRLDGAGHPIQRPDIDIALAEWITEKRTNKQPVSRNIIRRMAATLFMDTDIKASVGFIQASDVSWNKPFKERIRNFYNIWMSNEAEKEFTLAGNPKAPALHVVLDWIHRSWQEISKEVIIKSFEVCGLTTPLDGTGDEKIACFKPKAAIGPIGIKLLREFRATETVKDGRNDHEEAGLSDDDGDVEYIDHSVIAFIRANQQIFDRMGTNLKFDVSSSCEHEANFSLIWDVLASKIWPIFAPNIHYLQLPNGDDLNHLLRLCSTTILTDLNNLSFIYFLRMSPEGFGCDLDGPNATPSAGQALSKWLHIPRSDGQPKRLRCGDNNPENFEWINNFKQAFLRAATSAACYEIRFHTGVGSKIF
ncbi:hypothetical protein niasHT_026144 [Heterodera trifolii]|uniref:Uncharacterized protein n=1 Tax=Heterodera trifolii TaxID=157864 RepID=A0ABD2K0N7_9BILA